MRHCLVVVLAGTCSFLAGCVVIKGSGEVETRSHPVRESHDEIEVCCGFQLWLEEGEPELDIRADDNILDDVVVKDRGDRLVIEYDRPTVTYFPSEPVEVHAALKQVNRVETSGGATAEVDPIDGSLLRVILSGGSDADFHGLDVGELRFQASGGSHARLTGEAGTQLVTLSGGSEYEAFGLKSEDVEIEASGGSTAEVDVRGELDVTASGGSQIFYEGEPDVIRELSGGSTVRSAD